jgi:uncharacterized protein (TIGR00369 family)
MVQLTEGATGVELVQAMFDGRLPPPGALLTLGMEGVHVEEGRVVFALDPGPEHGNPMGTTHGGILATLLDSAMTCAVHSKLPAGAWPTTLEISVRFLRPIPPGSGRIEAEGVAVQVGSRVGTAEGRITGADGTLYATGTTTCLVLKDER